MNKIKDFFDNLAPNWDKKEIIPPKRREELVDFASIKKGEEILDIGCGTGVISETLFNKSNVKVDAIDLSSEMIKIAKSKISNDKVNFICDDFYTYNFIKKYDLAIIYNAYPHFVDVDKFIKKLHSILKKNGRFLIIHSFTLNGLKMHHKNVKSSLSREINSLEEEKEKFNNLFKTIKFEEGKDYFYIQGIKK